MESVRAGPNAFFRLGPVDRAEAHCFGVKRGEIAGRFDVNYWQLGPLVSFRMGNSAYPVDTLGNALIRAQYGSSTLATTVPDGTPILRMNNLQDDGWDLSNLKYVDLPDEQVELYRLEQGDILFNRTNSKELVGKCAVFNEPGLWVFASYLIRVKTDSTRLNHQFAADFLSTPIGRLQIDRFSRQIIGMTNINAEEIKLLQIPVPSLLDQGRFVKAMDAARVARKSKLEEADGQKKAFSNYLVGTLGLKLPPASDRNIFALTTDAIKGGLRYDPGYHHPKYADIMRAFKACDIPKVPLGIISPTMVGGATPTRGDANLYAEDGIKLLRIMNVRENAFDLNDLNYIQPHVHEGKLQRSKLEIGDVLMGDYALYKPASI